MPPTNIAFVYFDLGNVLVAFDPKIACANVARCFGVSHQQAHHALYESGLQNRFEQGQVDGETFAETLRKQLDQRGSPGTNELLDAVSAMFTPIESMRDTLQRVRDREKPLGILSNTCFAHWDWIRRQTYAVMGGDFNAIVLSYEVGSMKPDPKIYAAAEEAAGVPPDQILFLDDKPENVEGARRRGWQAEQCFGGPQSEQALRDYGVI